MKRRELLRFALGSLAAGPARTKLLAAALRETAASPGQGGELPYDRMASQIVKSLRPERGERVILRHDPTLLTGLMTEAKRQLEAAGCVVEPLAYGAADGFESRLAQTDIYIWLPAGRGPSGNTPADQVGALVRWLDAGRGRQIHFHWGDGTRDVDSTNGEHSAAYDRVYLAALDIDYAKLNDQMDAAIVKLRSGEVRVTTPAGTDLRFRLGDRPVCKQNGDASREQMKSARVRIDHEIELPAGALRVAPIEESVSGRIMIRRARIGGIEAQQIELTFEKGAITQTKIGYGMDAVMRYLASNEVLRHFREFALGMNAKLVKPAGGQYVPYYGYGAGVVRLSLGDNEELGGAVRGGAVHWFFFPDATVRAGSATLSVNGALK